MAATTILLPPVGCRACGAAESAVPACRLRSSFKSRPISFRAPDTSSGGSTQTRGRSRKYFQTNAVTSSSDLPVLTFPAFLPPDVELIRETVARNLAAKIQHVPVQTSLAPQPIMTSCVIPKTTSSAAPVVLLHGFDSSLLEWRYSYPVLEEAGVETWAVDFLGGGFSRTEGVKSYNVAARREHLYEFWKTYVKRPMVLVGPSLGGAAAIDLAVAHPDAVAKLVLVDAQGYTEGLGEMATMPKLLAYTGVALLKSVPLRLYANTLIFTKATFDFLLNAMRVGRLHTLMPGWADNTVNFMMSGGYNVVASIPQVQQETLLIWGERDTIVPKTFADRFLADLPNARLKLLEDTGHLPHVEKPQEFASLLKDFYLQANRPSVECTTNSEASQ